jgi:hypothetical protein
MAAAGDRSSAMLTPSQIVPFLMHEDYFVRGHALRYLIEGTDRAGITGDDLWHMIDQFGHSHFREELHALSKVPTTEASLERTLQELPKKDKENHRPLLNAICECDLELLARLRNRVLSEPSLDAPTRQHLSERLALLDNAIEPQTLWDKLLILAEEADKHYVTDPPAIECRRQADVLLEALARSRAYAAEVAARAIADLSIEEKGYYRQVYAMRLVGMIRDGSSVESLIALLDWKYNDWAQDAAKALVQINSPLMVDLVADRYRLAGHDRQGFCMTATDVLRHLRDPKVETRLAEFFPKEEDVELRTDLAACLCDICTTDRTTLELLRQYVNSNEYDGFIANLNEAMYPVCVMAGFEIPELPAWRREAERIHRRMMAAFPRFRRLMESTPPEEAKEEADDETSDPVELDDHPPPLPPDLDDNPQVTGTFRRAEPKVGRNDPCPCGSGKKYKKCCGK